MLNTRTRPDEKSTYRCSDYKTSTFHIWMQVTFNLTEPYCSSM